MNGDSRYFPNATLRADQDDIDYWLDSANLEAAPEGQKGFFRGAMASLNPYIEAGAFEVFEGPQELVPGIYSQADPGHTPGHSTYRVESDDEGEGYEWLPVNYTYAPGASDEAASE